MIRNPASDTIRESAETGAAILQAIQQEPAVTRPNVRSTVETIAFLRWAGMPIDDSDMYLVSGIAMWAASGFNVFNLTHSLAAALILTEPPEYEKGERLYLPFPAFFITLPPNTLPVLSQGRKTWADMVRVAVSEDGSDGMFMVSASSSDPPQEVGSTFPMADLVLSDSHEVIGEIDPDHLVTIRATLRLVRNFVMWLEATGGIKNRSPLSRPKKKSDRSGPRDWPTTWILGQEVKLSRELREMAAESVLGRSSLAVPGWKLRMQHVVRGHWKSQAHGSGRLSRKQIWVEPYWRGPEGAAAWGHLYQGRDK